MKKPSFFRITSRASRSKEDQLTEVVAFVFNVAPALAQVFAREIFRNIRAGQAPSTIPEYQDWDVETQFAYQGEQRGRPDLILSSDTHRVWVEAKLDSGPGPDQLLKYYMALRKECDQEGVEGALVYLTREGASSGPVRGLREDLCKRDLPGQGDPAVCEYDWTKLESAMVEASGDESIQERLARELAIYLNDCEAMVRPLDKKSPSLILEYRGVRDGLWDLLEGVAGQVYEAMGDRKEDNKRPRNKMNWPDFPRYQFSYDIPGSEEVLGYPLLLEWNFDVREEWEGRRVPAFGWGLTLDSEGGLWPGGSEELVDRMNKGGFLCLADVGYPRLYRHKFLDDVLNSGDLTKDRVKALSGLVVPGLMFARDVAESWLDEDREGR